MGFDSLLGHQEMIKKLRVYDSKFLAETYSITTQMQGKIDNVLSGEGMVLEKLPVSMVPTSTLYEILVCFEVMFLMLYDEHLIKDAHIKPTKTIQ